MREEEKSSGLIFFFAGGGDFPLVLLFSSYSYVVVVVLLICLMLLERTRESKKKDDWTSFENEPNKMDKSLKMNQKKRNIINNTKMSTCGHASLLPSCENKLRVNLQNLAKWLGQ